jgi:poly-gamma-glutamate synthesis protein (capsule biosynthesis protein)
MRFFWIFLLTLTIPFSIGMANFAPIGEPLSNLENQTWAEKSVEAVPEEPISMLFTGDIMLDRYVDTLRTRQGGDFPFTHMPEILAEVKSQLGVESLDVVAGNLEGPITDSNYKNPGTAMRFNFRPDVVPLLKKAGFTHFNMANNHTLDQGKDGVRQTHDYLAPENLFSFGHPDTPNGTYSFLIQNIQGHTIGFLGLNDAVTHLDKTMALAKIQEVSPQVDFLVIAVHWGAEYQKTASAATTALAHEWVDAGADLIWGTHPHVVQNSEVYRGAPIYYSLGNFVFDQYWSQETQKGLVLGLKLSWAKDHFEAKTVEVPIDLSKDSQPRLFPAPLSSS